MSILYRWLDNKKSKMSFIFHSSSTWDNFYDVLYEVFNEIHTVNHPVDIIVDLSRMKNLPKGIIKELHYLSQLEHINLRHRLLISSNPLMNEIYQAFTRSYPLASQQLQLLPCMEAVYHFIDEQSQIPSA